MHNGMPSATPSRRRALDGACTCGAGLLTVALGAVRLAGHPVAAAESLAQLQPPVANVAFNRDVRPILNTCFRCHGPDESARRAGLRLDMRDEALRVRANGAPIVPGKPAESVIIKRIFETDLARIMPPASIHKELSDAQKETIRRWVEQGAEYQGHWAYQPIERPAVPAIAGAAIRTPIDAFVQARLAQEGLKPAPEADRATLIRRVTLDLTGLAPTPGEVGAFLQDRSPNAYERLVDRLMASPR